LPSVRETEHDNTVFDGLEGEISYYRMLSVAIPNYAPAKHTLDAGSVDEISQAALSKLLRTFNCIIM
jgi:hypothetical protein